MKKLRNNQKLKITNTTLKPMKMERRMEETVEEGKYKEKNSGEARNIYEAGTGNNDQTME